MLTLCEVQELQSPHANGLNPMRAVFFFFVFFLTGMSIAFRKAMAN